MAGIDKTYIDGRDYKLYRQWWIDNYDKMMKELPNGAIYLYPFSIFRVDEVTPDYLAENSKDLDYWSTMYDFAIWNTTEGQDKWLIKNCNITSFIKRMVECYPPNWSGFKGKTLIFSGYRRPRYRNNSRR